MLQGMVIGAIKVTPAERLQYMADFIPKINSWSVCDCFCSGLKFANKNQELVWDFLQPYLHSGKEYQIRFAVIMLMDYYLTVEYIDLVLPLLDGVAHDGYYVKMAVAWALATALAKQPEKNLGVFSAPSFRCRYVEKNYSEVFGIPPHSRQSKSRAAPDA